MRFILPTALILAALTGCTFKWEVPDGDGDGFTLTDCDDNDAAINPSATEVCDGVDNNCDGQIDESGGEWYADADGDGYGDSTTLSELCEQPEGYVDVGDDCDDTNAESNPEASEICDGLDNNCDGAVDEDLATTWYQDDDGDGYGDDEVTSEACEQPEGYVSVSGDCDDNDAAFNPDALEEDCADPNDYNCDGSTGYNDADGDGFAACEDCDDADSSINPGQPEECDGVDNDCDGEIDADAIDADMWYRDDDSDGYGDPSIVENSCDEPTGFADNSDDCDDADASVNPAETEVCDEVDNDCDGDIDDDDRSLDTSTATSWYADDDGDGYGATGTMADRTCEAPSSTIDNDDDCDDTDASVNTAASEVCDEVDNDCDGDIDDDDSTLDVSTTTDWFLDADGDGFGLSGTVMQLCDQPSSYIDNDTDCDDNDAEINPDELDLTYDGIEQDCDPEPELVWCVDRFSGDATELDLVNEVSSVIVSGQGELLGVAFDGVDTIYWSQIVADTITSYNLATQTVTTYTTTFSSPAGLSWDPYNDQLLVAELGSGEVAGFDPAADSKTTLCSGLGTIVDVVATSATTVDVADRDADAIVECDTSLGTQTNVWSITDPTSVVLGYATSLADGTVEDSSGTQVFTGLGTNNGRGLAWSPDGSQLVVGDLDLGQVYLFTPSGTAVTPSSSGVTTLLVGGEPFECVSNARL
jgi:hypothetical protein